MGPLPAKDELGFLVEQFNRMGQELDAQRQRLVAVEKIAAWQEVARHLAHELKNPLTAMQLALSRISRSSDGELPPEVARERIGEATALLQDELHVLGRMTASFSEFARLPPPSLTPVDVRRVVTELCALYREQGARAEEIPQTAAMTLADEDQLHRALGNLLKNAVEASPNGAPVEVSVERGKGRILVRVRDHGPGVSTPIEGPALFRGLASTKPDGSGLGLPITHKIVTDHGGRLRLEPASGGGTVALVELPESQPDSPPASLAGAEES
jgi:nitrogen fixation/metabolism regulation signal transduction histidine kinase